MKRKAQRSRGRSLASRSKSGGRYRSAGRALSRPSTWQAAYGFGRGVYRAAKAVSRGVRTAKRLRSGKSTSRTTTKTKKRFESPKSDHFAGSVSSLRIGFGVKQQWLRGFMKKYARPHILRMTHAESQAVGVGRQTYALLRPVDVTGITTDWFIPSWTLNQHLIEIQDGTGLSLIPGTPATNDRLVINFIKIRVAMRNMSTDKCFVKLYDCVPRHDQIVTATSPLDPASAWTQGLSDESVTVPLSGIPTAANYATVGNTPFQSEKFTEYYHVKKVNSFSLQPGGEHVHHVTIRPGRVFKKYAMQQFTQMAHLSWSGLMVFYGDIVKDQVTPFATSTGQSEISTVITTTVEFTTLTKVMKTFSTYENLPTVLTTPAVVQVATGGITADANV